MKTESRIGTDIFFLLFVRARKMEKISSSPEPEPQVLFRVLACTLIFFAWGINFFLFLQILVFFPALYEVW